MVNGYISYHTPLDNFNRYALYVKGYYREASLANASMFLL